LLSADRGPSSLPVVVFALGAVSALISILASTTQHDYYRNVRDRKAELEKRLGLGDLAIKTTQGMGGLRERLASVTTFQKLILGALLCADLAGSAAALDDAWRPPPPKAAVVARLDVTAANDSRTVQLVFAQDGQLVASASGTRTRNAILRLEPGTYNVSVLGRRLCVRSVTVTDAPLQSLTVRCR